MKRIFLPLALLSMLACGSDSETLDTIDPNVGTIIGKWYIEKSELYTSKDHQTKTNFSTDCQKKSTHEFRQTNMTSTTYAQQSTTCIQTDVVTRNYTFDKPTGQFWYEGEQDYPYFVTKLTQSEMIMEDRTQDMDGDGINDVIRRFFTRIN
ncbi:lipocalin family protein [Chryseobacterium sp. PTM-20240506]|uniref:lipocalin family protein n=1 Tax=unclassified Chryseobacterium TaxID=2593645 RepID=UPI0027964097|nr:lipocalin family protein [Chryseobacterium sp. CKR4-1]MDQ1805806.1 lipocalin family protein [Chryseobacterium sp. CKR4-1]